MNNRFAFKESCGKYINGFSLIELMIVLTILGILASIAIPTYREYVIAGCRRDAMISLEKVSNEQSQFYWDRNRYAPNMVSVSVPTTSSGGYYSISSGLIGGNTNTFIAKAIQAGGECLPANDYEYRISHTGLREQKASGGAWVEGWDKQ